MSRDATNTDRAYLTALLAARDLRSPRVRPEARARLLDGAWS